MRPGAGGESSSATASHVTSSSMMFCGFCLGRWFTSGGEAELSRTETLAEILYSFVKEEVLLCVKFQILKDLNRFVCCCLYLKCVSGLAGFFYPLLLLFHSDLPKGIFSLSLSLLYIKIPKQNLTPNPPFVNST